MRKKFVFRTESKWYRGAIKGEMSKLLTTADPEIGDTHMEKKTVIVALIAMTIFAAIVILGESGAPPFELYTIHLGPLTLSTRGHGWVYMREGEGVLGFLAAAFLIGSVVFKRRLRTAAFTLLCVTTAAAGILSIFSVAALRPQAHDSRDQLLYYLGSKYYDEIGYNVLARCIIEAAWETGVPPPPIYRDQATNAVIDSRRSIAMSEPCRKRFSEKRWEEFKTDVSGFTPALTAWQGQWQKTLCDHGFNGTPVVRRLIAATAKIFPATRRGLTLYAFLNLAAVMLALLAVLKWVGARESAVCALLIFVYAGDSFIHLWSIPRYFWLSSILVGVSLLYRGGKWAVPVAGAFLMFSAGLKVFPAAWLAGPALLTAVELIRRNRGDGFRMMTGAAVAGVVLFAWTVSDAHHLDNWFEFIDRIQQNGNRATTGCIGFAFNFLRPLPGPDLDLRPMQAAIHIPRLGPFTLHHFQLLLQVLLSAAVLRACLRIDYARAAVLSGFGLVFLWTVPVSYYYAGFLGLPLLFPHARNRVLFTVSSVLLLLMAAVSGMLFERVIEPILYTAFLSSGFTVFLCFALIALEIERRRARPFFS